MRIRARWTCGFAVGVGEICALKRSPSLDLRRDLVRIAEQLELGRADSPDTSPDTLGRSGAQDAGWSAVGQVEGELKEVPDIDQILRDLRAAVGTAFDEAVGAVQGVCTELEWCAVKP
jgi:hypothetical protein